MGHLTIGELAKVTGVTKVAIRYYERCGLLPKAARSASGYRWYPENMIGRIRFITNAKSVGFTLEEIQALFNLQAQQKTSSRQIKTRTLEKLALIQEKIQSLQKIASALEQLAASCDGRIPLRECPILEALYHDEAILNNVKDTCHDHHHCT